MTSTRIDLDRAPRRRIVVGLLATALGVLPLVPVAGIIDAATPIEQLNWTQLGADIDGEAAGDASGHAVSISDDGNTVAIGAIGNSGGAGHVRVLRRDGTTWTQLGADIDGQAGDFSGWAVSLSSDGDTVAIGAPYNSGGAGVVRVYQWDSTTWTQLGADIAGEAAGDSSGWSVSLSADGTTVAIGANGNSGGAGHVRVYQLDASTWTQVGDDIDGEAAGDKSGHAVSISDDGTTVAIGAIGNSGFTGHVRVYQLSASTWTQVGDDIDGEAAGDVSGTAVSLSADGTTVAIGATANSANAGHVRIHQWTGTTWTQVGDDIDGEAASDRSGGAVSLSADGTAVAIGAIGNSGFAGHVRIHQWTGTAWTQVGDDIVGKAAGDYSGNAVALSADGTTVVVGASGERGPAGYVRIFGITSPTTTTIPATTVPAISPTPAGAVTDPVAVTPGQPVTVTAPCTTGTTVQGTLGDQTSTADCVPTTAALGLVQAVNYNGLATFTFTAPATPGVYGIEIELVGTGIRYVIPLNVTGGQLPATGTGTSSNLGLAVALLGAGAIFVTTTRRRRHI
jgi:LPXTG-motif cell wall-anchored protein